MPPLTHIIGTMLCCLLPHMHTTQDSSQMLLLPLCISKKSTAIDNFHWRDTFQDFSCRTCQTVSLMWMRWNHSRENCPSQRWTEKPLWSEVRSRRKGSGGKKGWVGGREQVSTSVLLKPFTDLALSHTCYFTLWHSLLEVFRPEMFLKAVLSLNNTISLPMYWKTKTKPKTTISFTSLSHM